MFVCLCLVRFPVILINVAWIIEWWCQLTGGECSIHGSSCVCVVWGGVGVAVHLCSHSPHTLSGRDRQSRSQTQNKAWSLTAAVFCVDDPCVCVYVLCLTCLCGTHTSGVRLRSSWSSSVTSQRSIWTPRPSSSRTENREVSLAFHWLYTSSLHLNLTAGESQHTQTCTINHK